MVNNLNIAPIVEPTQREIDDNEKVEVMIKEVIRIKPIEFSSFKHALEDFVRNWEDVEPKKSIKFSTGK